MDRKYELIMLGNLCISKWRYRESVREIYGIMKCILGPSAQGHTKSIFYRRCGKFLCRLAPRKMKKFFKLSMRTTNILPHLIFKMTFFS
jgi:hypothetical protein